MHRQATDRHLNHSKSSVAYSYAELHIFLSAVHCIHAITLWGRVDTCAPRCIKCSNIELIEKKKGVQSLRRLCSIVLDFPWFLIRGSFICFPFKKKAKTKSKEPLQPPLHSKFGCIVQSITWSHDQGKGIYCIFFFWFMKRSRFILMWPSLKLSTHKASCLWGHRTNINCRHISMPRNV